MLSQGTTTLCLVSLSNVWQQLKLLRASNKYRTKKETIECNWKKLTSPVWSEAPYLVWFKDHFMHRGWATWGLFKFYHLQIPVLHRQTWLKSLCWSIMKIQSAQLFTEQFVCLWFVDSASASAEWPSRTEELGQRLNIRLQLKVMI